MVMADFVVGIAGGIGSGKTAVSDRLKSLGITIADADVTAREVVEPGHPVLDALADHFGSRILTADGHLDRPALRELIFENSEERRWVEKTMHPAINRTLADQLAGATSPYAVLVNPLMRDRDPRATRILVVDVPEDVQIRRTMARDNVDEAGARAVLASQVDRETRLGFADDVVVNDGSLEDLYGAVDQLHQKYVELARA